MLLRASVAELRYADGLHSVMKENGMDRAQKSEQVAALNVTLSQVGVVVVARNLGLTVAQSTDLRIKMRDAGASFKVTKNRLVRIAAEGTPYTALSSLLTGPCGLATSIDPVAAAKVVVEFAKTNDKLEILGGAMGDTLLDVNGIKALAELPSLDELRAKAADPKLAREAMLVSSMIGSVRRAAEIT